MVVVVGWVVAMVVGWVVCLAKWWLNGNDGFLGLGVVCVDLSAGLVGLLGGFGSGTVIWWMLV